MKSRLKTKKGITLIELLSAVVIIGIISAMAVPRFQTAFQKVKFRTTNRDITSELRLARSLAITNKVNYGVFFDGNARTLTLFKKDSSSATNYMFETTDSVVRVDTLPPEISYLGTDIQDNAVVYNPNGSANFFGGGNIITMVDIDEFTGISNIDVLASTGRVHSVSYYY
ncbi:MAG: prepilin-type N-terminal cleavage/methylation domain-containing protein [FCB group bacterium]|nr:prepilin-type N-terminal cleavage/methylation domain-containing protein [FCB group bacterium]